MFQKNNEETEFKSKNKKKLMKGVAIAAASIALAIVSAVSVLGFSDLQNKNKKTDEANDDVKLSYDELIPQLPIDNLRDKMIENSINVDDKIVDTSVSDVTKTIVKESRVKIGDNVNVKDNAYIYNNVYDAMNEENKYIPYFDNDMDRNVKGLFIDCDGSYIYTEDGCVAEELLSKKGIIKSVVVGDYEGAYNYNDIKIKVR